MKPNAKSLRQSRFIHSFTEEVELLTRSTRIVNELKLKKTSVLYKLDPYMDDYGLLRVGGRIDKCNLPHDVKHPVILPKVGHLTTLIVRHFHEKTSHQGRGITANEIRASGIWIVGCRAVVSGYIRRFVICRRFRGDLHTQKMAQLPDYRLQCIPPFTYCAVDYFGPFNIKDRRSVVPRYGVLFTCMMSRAIHLETANSLESDSFINALRRFISIRGPVRQLRCDRSTNFVGANNQLNRELASMTNRKVSHMGGVWERQIRTVRSVLVLMLENSGSQLDDESLRTLLIEVMCIVNSRPLSVNDLYDPSSTEPLTPNHILTMKTKIVLPPPGEFQLADLYSRKRRRRVQYMMCSGPDVKMSTYKHCKCGVNGTRTLVRFPRTI